MRDLCANVLRHFFPMSPFVTPENIRKPKVRNKTTVSFFSYAAALQFQKITITEYESKAESYSRVTFTCSKPTIEMLEKGVKYIQSQQ